MPTSLFHIAYYFYDIFLSLIQLSLFLSLYGMLGIVAYLFSFGYVSAATSLFS